MYNYKDIWNPVRLVVNETLNCEHEFNNPQDLYLVSLRKCGTTVGQVLHIISCICTLFFNTEAWWCHRAHFDSPQQYRFPRLATGRSRIALTVIYYLVRSFVYLP